MGEDPDAIRAEIEQTRAHMGDTVDALTYKADVKERAKDKVSETKDKISGAASRVTGRVSDATPDAGEVKGQARWAAGVAQENPLGLAIGSVAVGFLAGMLIPTHRIEDERIGPVAEKVREQVKETGQEAFEHGKEVAKEAASSAADTAKEAGRDRAQDLRDSAQQRAQDVSGSVSSS
jgi:gas vesicle protein